MKKYLVSFGMVLIFLTVGLSGCVEQKTPEDAEKVELVSYSVITQQKVKQGCCYEDVLIGSGFVHNKDADCYIVNGTIRNIAGVKLDTIRIKAKFYDMNNSELFTKSSYTTNLLNLYTGDFKLTIYKYNEHFLNVQHVKFEFEII